MHLFIQPVYRLLGIRHISGITRDTNADNGAFIGGRNVHYRSLGLILLTQVMVYGIMKLSKKVRNGASRLITEKASSREVKDDLVILDHDMKIVESVDDPVRSSSSTEVYLSKDQSPQMTLKCPLCLTASPLCQPTATPCGHIFCWSCVAEWCNEKEVRQNFRINYYK